MEVKEYCLVKDFFKPSTELCISWIHSNEAVIAKSMEEQQDEEEPAIIPNEIIGDIYNGIALEVFQQEFASLSAEQKQQIENGLIDKGFEQLGETEQKTYMDRVSQWLSENPFYYLNRLCREAKQGVDPVLVTTAEIRAYFLGYILNNDEQLAEKFEAELYAWVKAQPQPVVLRYGTIGYSEMGLMAKNAEFFAKA